MLSFSKSRDGGQSWWEFGREGHVKKGQRQDGKRKAGKGRKAKACYHLQGHLSNGPIIPHWFQPLKCSQYLRSMNTENVLQNNVFRALKFILTASIIRRAS